MIRGLFNMDASKEDARVKHGHDGAMFTDPHLVMAGLDPAILLGTIEA